MSLFVTYNIYSFIIIIYFKILCWNISSHHPQDIICFRVHYTFFIPFIQGKLKINNIVY